MLFEQLIKKVNSGSFSRFVTIMVMAGFGFLIMLINSALLSFYPQLLGQFNHSEQLSLIFSFFLNSLYLSLICGAALGLYISFFHVIKQRVLGIIFMLLSFVLLWAATLDLIQFVEPNNIEKQQIEFRFYLWLFVAGAIIIFVRLIMHSSRNMLLEYLTCVMFLLLDRIVYSILLIRLFGIVSNRLFLYFTGCLEFIASNSSICPQMIWYPAIMYARNIAFFVLYCGVVLVLMRYFYDQIKKQSI